MRNLLTIISPTWLFAKLSKKGKSPENRARGIILRNNYYACFSVISLCVMGKLIEDFNLRGTWLFNCILVFSYIFTWSRCNEIFIAFLSDALDKTAGDFPNSSLSYRKRVELSLISYLELIFNFALLYYLMPRDWFYLGSAYDKVDFLSVIDTIYFSGVTITTLGYGDISPSHWLPKFLVIQEILIGFTLLVVSFAIYAGKGIGQEQAQQKNQADG